MGFDPVVDGRDDHFAALALYHINHKWSSLLAVVKISAIRHLMQSGESVDIPEVNVICSEPKGEAKQCKHIV